MYYIVLTDYNLTLKNNKILADGTHQTVKRVYECSTIVQAHKYIQVLKDVQSFKFIRLWTRKPTFREKIYNVIWTRV